MADGDEEEAQETEAPPVALDPVDLTEDMMVLTDLGNTVDGQFALRQLDCEGKQIGNIDVLQQFVYLTQINLSRNLVKDIQPLASLPHVLKLNLSKNGIESLEPLMGLCHLMYLDVSGNELMSLPELPMESLKEANFSGNKISSCTAFKGHPKLQILDLSCNQIEAFTGIRDMPELKTLRLSKNKGVSVQGLEQLDTLQVLDLAGNAFDSFTGCMEFLEAITELNLSQNKIASASKLQGVEGLPNLAKLQIDQNPLEEEEGGKPRLEVILFQEAVKEINGEPVTPEERTDAIDLRNKRIEEAAERRRQEEEERAAAEEARRQAEEEERLAREAAEAEAAEARLAEEEARRQAEEEEALRSAEEAASADAADGGGEEGDAE